MKKVLSSILISLIIFVNLFAPFSAGFSGGRVEINKNEARAEYNYNLEITPVLGDTYITINIKVVDGSSVSDAAIGVISQNANLQVYATVLKNEEKVDDGYTTLGSTIKQATIELDGSLFSKLEQSTPYKTKIEVKERLSTQTNTGTVATGNDTFKTLYETILDTPTIKTGEQEVVSGVTGVTGNSDTLKAPESNSKDMPECGLGTPMGCVAQFFYYVFFVPTSYLFALSGTFFDTTFAYSVQDNSYRSTFVVQGWGLARDFCNLFFIFILLYVAISTILDIHGFNTKQTIIRVVIIGLFINFSLFATQVIIDASNITARVFYNADIIKLEEEGANGVAKATPGLTIREDGVIPLSAGIVNKVNPQNLIFQSKKINNIPDKGTASSTDKTNIDKDRGNLSISSFILITLIASAVNIVGFVVFLSVGMLFVGRIIGLWIAMILAPLAFFTYILPEELAGIKMIGWKNWWPETLKLAFLAPVFIFFMYLILKFLSMDLVSDITGKSLIQDGLGYFISILMPFAFIMFLMMKAKGIAKDMAGWIGEYATKAGSAVGGVALGGAVGLGAMAMRGTVGRMGNALANSSTVKNWERRGYFGADKLRDFGKAAGSGSFDIRGTKAGAAAGKGLGVDMGKAKEGGFVKARADNVAYRQKRATELELHEDTEQVQNVRHAEHALHAIKTDPDRQNTTLDLNNGINNDPARVQAVLDAANLALPIAEAALVTAETNLTAAEAALAADPANQALITARFDALNNRDIARGNRNDARSAVTSALVGDMGMGALERFVAQAEGHVARAERAVKDAETAYLATATQANRDALDNAIQDRDAEINGGLRSSGRVNADGTITTNVETGRDQARANKLAREATIRAHERPVNVAEDALARAQNEVIRENNETRHLYANSIQGAWSNAINGVLTLGEHSALGEREASYKVLAGAHEEAKTKEHH